ncbi:polysaccharide biosynthesis protein [Caproiciproducens sp. NJN-50]|uniref:putative polysaccharide biosynthesis protein n=1 Tax=Acutalibacteraceae TaxID=3082771 RepID=UPI000FFDFA15|nr:MULTISPECIES: polysaccharide biosynthesis protein [Acutalibacteraceae]QAT49998.1 polysaccharide biosynthesis protein [Caproiciproducens sp. NJN-50]
MEQRKNPPARRQSFLHGALILMVAYAVEKLIGAFFKIPLTWILTPTGNGYFSNAYSLYAPLYSLATAGFPIAISRLVSENSVRGRFRDVRQIHRASIRIFLILGILSFSIMFFGARPYANYVLSGSPQNALPAIYALAPAVFFTSMMSIYRGYYEGLRNMVPTAISEVCESLCRLIFGLSAAYLVVWEGMREYAASGTVFGAPMKSAEYAKLATLPYASAGAVFGVTLGGMTGFLFLLFYHRHNGDGISREMLLRSPKPLPMRVTSSRLIRTAVPVALGSLAVNLSTLVDSTFLQMRIKDIMDSSPQVLLNMYKGIIPQSDIQLNLVPSFLFGCFSNATVFFMLVPGITQALGVSALPSVTAAWTQGDPKRIKHSIESVLRIVTLMAIPSGLGLSMLSTPIAKLVLRSGNAPEITGKILVILGLAAIFASISTPINSMLQAIGRVDLPVKLLAVGLVVKIILNYTLVGIPEINVMGAGTGTLVCYFLITFLSLYFLIRETGVMPNLFAIFVKPALASGISVGAAWMLQRTAAKLIPEDLATVLAILAAAFLYLICILWFRALSRRDIIMLPKGQKIVKILEKHHWIR